MKVPVLWLTVKGGFGVDSTPIIPWQTLELRPETIRMRDRAWRSKAGHGLGTSDLYGLR